MIMFTSNVSARGVDYPNVTLIVQVGVTEREPYIHRLGRTARSSGIEGRGVLLLAPFEKGYMDRQLKGLPISEIEYKKPSAEISKIINGVLSKVQKDPELLKSAELCY